MDPISYGILRTKFAVHFWVIVKELASPFFGLNSSSGTCTFLKIKTHPSFHCYYQCSILSKKRNSARLVKQHDVRVVGRRVGTVR